MTRVGALRRFGADRGGASAVEFALVVVPLLLLVFGGIEYGRLLWTRTALEEAAMSGARCMGVKGPSCMSSGSYSATQTSTYVRGQASSWMVTVPASGVTLSNAATCSGVSGFSQVTIDYTFQTAVPLILGSLASGLPIRAVACFPNQS